MLKGKSAIVTGSTSGIGLGIAQALAGAGVNGRCDGFGSLVSFEGPVSGARTSVA